MQATRIERLALKGARLGKIWFLAAFFAFWFLDLSPCLAQGFLDLNRIQPEYLITNGSASATGELSIYVSFPDWFSRTAGYCPIRARVVPSKGLVFKSDGVLKLNICTGNRVSEEGPCAVIEVEIEKGASEARGEILANMFEIQMVTFYATLNGRKLNGQKSYCYNSGRADVPFGQSMAIISQGTSTSDQKRRAALAEMTKSGNWFSQEEFFLSTGSKGHYADVSKLPSNWLALSGIAQLSIHLDDLALLAPAQLDAIKHYVLAGGMLSVGKVESMKEFTQHIPIDTRRKWDPSAANSARSITDPSSLPAQVSDLESSIDLLEDTVWDRFMAIEKRIAFLNNRSGMGYGGAYGYGQYALGSESTRAKRESPPRDLLGWSEKLGNDLAEVGLAYIDFHMSGAETLASRFYGADEVFTPKANEEDILTQPIFLLHGFGIVRLDPRSPRDSAQLLSELSKESLYQPINRTDRFKNGIGDDFWDWLIPAVGRTPVIPFMTFVVLFVGIVVPGLMIWCNRHKRRVWLVVAMPLTAAIFTLLLFSYGILKDGFGAISRTRSLAFVDINGDGVVWSRQNYFAARIPEQGIVLSGDTQIAPMQVHSNIDLRGSQQIDLDGKQQYIGLIPPRLQTQFSVTHPLRKIRVLTRGSTQDPALIENSIINDSKCKWTIAMFINQEGKAFIAKDVSDGQAAVLTETPMEDSIALMRKAYQATPLSAPLDAPSANQISLSQKISGVFSYSGNYRPNSVGLISEEKVWAQCVGLSSPQVSTNNPFQRFEMLPGTFILFTEQAPYLERCLPNVQDEHGLHTVIGQW